jgi:D-xylose transport system ATP-binding protein
MVGREIEDLYPKLTNAKAAPRLRADNGSKAAIDATAPLLSVCGLNVAPRRGEPLFLRDIAFEVRAGEVLGIGGLMGAGRTELLMHLFGAWGYRVSGDVSLRGEPYPQPSPRNSIERGLVLASEDRRRYGLILEQEIGFNLSLSSLRQFTTTAGRLNQHAEYARNHELFDALRIKAPDQHANAAGLSGGNQQKVVLGKALMAEPAVVMLDEPTRGIDVGAKVEIYELVRQLTASGKGVLLVSSELPELIGLSDRILMLAEGRIGGEFGRGDFTEERLLAAAMGHSSAV